MSHPDQVPLYPCYRTKCDWPDVHCPACAAANSAANLCRACRKSLAVPHGWYCCVLCVGVGQGREEMVRVFWQGVCEKKAQKKEKLAAKNDRRADNWDNFEIYWQRAAELRAEASQLRQWASEG